MWILGELYLFHAPELHVQVASDDSFFHTFCLWLLSGEVVPGFLHLGKGAAVLPSLDPSKEPFVLKCMGFRELRHWLLIIVGFIVM